MSSCRAAWTIRLKLRSRPKARRFSRARSLTSASPVFRTALRTRFMAGGFASKSMCSKTALCSLLVVDTGGWYKLCCPSSQLAKPDVLGAIYRVRKHGAPKLPNSARRNEYARVIGPSLDITKNWVALKQSAMQRESKAASVMQELLQETTATAATSNDSARAARIAAEGLGRLGYRPGVPALLHATGFTGDAILE